MSRKSSKIFRHKLQENNKSSVILAEKISKKFQERHLFKEISLNIKAGEAVGLLGPNGSGKTTLLNIFLGLLRPDSGNIYIFNLPLESHLQAIRRRINYASAFTQLPGYSTVYENLKTFAGLYEVDGARVKIDKLLRTFKLSEPSLKRKKVFKLSSGENTKLNLCKALLNDPEILLLDEPTAGLDGVAKRNLLDLIKSIKQHRQMTVVYATNIVAEAKKICERVLLLKNGKIISINSSRLVE